MSFIFTLVIMAIVFGAIYFFQNRGGEKVSKAEHEFLSRLWLWPRGEHTRWEAEYDLASQYSGGIVGLHAEDNYDTLDTPEPTTEEVAFAKQYLSNLELLFPVVVSGVEKGWSEWFHEELPIDWESQFIVDGFSVPVHGKVANKWSVTLYCEKAGHYFNLIIEDGVSSLESIDG